ncbi:MAG TPA: IclR family transcriptional regulator C-terminal domain-containing protein [Bryobacteraceae bacterium]|nr:IclR family transcriptional regulator C-terminal domain-containing protein [Bryobacteraceae bacterium]
MEYGFLRCIGAPVRNSSGQAVAAISIAGPLSRITADRAQELARRVLVAAKSLSDRCAKNWPSLALRVP